MIALRAVEILNVAQQLVSGLLTANEAVAAAKNIGEFSLPYQAGDLDYITGLRY